MNWFLAAWYAANWFQSSWFAPLTQEEEEQVATAKKRGSSITSNPAIRQAWEEFREEEEEATILHIVQIGNPIEKWEQ